MGHHNHDHHYEHHHDHEHHHHDHPNDVQSSMSFDEKLAKLFEHWIKHNEDHAKTYKEWAKKAAAEDRATVASLLDEAADMTLQISKKFEAAAKGK
jgi:hypothetical protein